jgi:hypothetical protein
MNEVVSMVLTFKDGSTQTITVTQNITMEDANTVPAEEIAAEVVTEAEPVTESAPEVAEEANAEEAAPEEAA